MRDADQTAAVAWSAPRRTGAPERLASGLLLLVALTTGLITLGAMVRAHEAGLACPDWPLCFGEIIPPMDLRVGFEWAHRAVAGGVSVLFLALWVAAWRNRRHWSRVRWWLWSAAGLLLAQILLGALTVWKLLAAWTVTAHLLTGNAFNACVWIAAFRLRGEPTTRVPPSAGLRLGGTLAGLLLVLQMVLGGLVSSTFAGLACPAWPTCNGDVFVPALAGSVGLHLAHRWNAVLVVLAIAALSYLGRGCAGAPWWAAAAVLACVQWSVGVANVLLGIPVEVTALHSALAAAMVLCVARALHDAWTAHRSGQL